MQMVAPKKARDLALQQNEEMHTEIQTMWAETKLLHSMLCTEPVYRVQMLNSLRAVAEEAPFHGNWIANTATCEYVCCGSQVNKATFDGGFVMMRGGHRSLPDVWVGNTFKQLAEVKATLKIDVADQALRHLVQSGEPAYFVRTDFPGRYPVFKMDAEQVGYARKVGYTTELEPQNGEKNRTRQVEKGDQILALPLGSNWTMPLRIFPADRLPEDRYRRV